MTQKKSVNYKLSKEFARKKWGRFMASIILKNNSFGGPTHFDRRVATFESKPRVTRERHLAEKQTKNSLFLHFCTWQLWFQKSIFRWPTVCQSTLKIREKSRSLNKEAISWDLLYIKKISTYSQLSNEPPGKNLGSLLPEKRVGWKSKASKKVGRI